MRIATLFVNVYVFEYGYMYLRMRIYLYVSSGQNNTLACMYFQKGESLCPNACVFLPMCILCVCVVGCMFVCVGVWVCVCVCEGCEGVRERACMCLSMNIINAKETKIRLKKFTSNSGFEQCSEKQ